MSKKNVYPIVIRDEHGRETYREEANGHWVKREYDEHGRQTYWETNRGGWAKHKYDDKGRETYYENSDGFWFKKEFNEAGFVTYYEDSTGTVQAYGKSSVDDVLKMAQDRSGQTEPDVLLQEKADVNYVKE